MPRKAYSSSYSSSSSSSYETVDDDENDDDESADDIFKEAEEIIKSNLAKLFNVGSNCGVRTDRRGRVIDDPSDEPIRPTWRMDPQKSFADWKLIVRDGSTSKIYHLHKGVLAHGPRSSRFFVREFEEYHNIGSSHRRDAATSGGGKARAVTEVALPKRSAMLLPALLDFIYDDKLNLTSANAPPIRHLANHFDVRQLYTLVSSFIQKDLRSSSTAPIYVQQADLVNDKELLSMATETTARCLQTVKDTDLVTVPPRLLPQVLSHPSAFYPSSEWLSELIARYVRGRGRLERKHQQTEERRERHQRQLQQQQQSRNKKKTLPPPPPPSEPFEVITDETFYFMTHAQILPRIAPSEAMWFLTFTKETYGEDVLADESMGGKEGSLKRRCVLAVSRDWKWMLVGPLRYDRVHNHNAANPAAASDADIKRRLFVEGEEDGDSEQLKVYKSLPVDLRLEILEESLLNAAENNQGQQGPLQTPTRPSSSSHPQHTPPQPLQSLGTPVSHSSMSSSRQPQPQPPQPQPPQLQPLPTTPQSAPLLSPHNSIMPSMHNTQQVTPPPPSPYTQHPLTPPPPPPQMGMDVASEFEKRGDSERRREYQHTGMREESNEMNPVGGQTATLSSSQQKRLNREISEGGRRTFMV